MASLKSHKTETVIIDGKAYLTYHWRLNCAQHIPGDERHNIFFAQFGEKVKGTIRKRFTEQEWDGLAGVTDQGRIAEVYQLERWENVDVRHEVGRLFTECCYADVPRGRVYWSASDNACIIEAAIRILLKERAEATRS